MEKKVVELFAGVGGFRLGLERANNFDVVWGNQWEPSRKTQHAYDCYARHFEGKGEHSNEDISTVDTENMPNHNLLVGGFPCQDYSVARTQAEGIQGKKGVLFWEIIRILEEKRPPFVLLENVDRLLKSPSKQRGRDFLVMLKAFHDLGYGVEWRVINAADYGFAQKRKRVFIYAFHENTKYFKAIEDHSPQEIIHNQGLFQKEFPIEGESSEKHPSTRTKLFDDIVKVSDEAEMIIRNSGVMLKGEVYSEETLPIKINPITLGEILESGVDEKYYLDDEEAAKWKYLKDYKRIERVSKTGHKYIYSEGQMSFPDPLDKPARTILTSESSKNRSSHVVEDPETGRLRMLTPLECERINGFEDNWTEGMPHKFRYFCMGNALVVGIIEKIGSTLSDIMDNE